MSQLVQMVLPTQTPAARLTRASLGSSSLLIILQLAILSMCSLILFRLSQAPPRTSETQADTIERGFTASEAFLRSRYEESDLLNKGDHQAHFTASISGVFTASPQADAMTQADILAVYLPSPSGTSQPVASAAQTPFASPHAPTQSFDFAKENEAVARKMPRARLEVDTVTPQYRVAAEDALTNSYLARPSHFNDRAVAHSINPPGELPPMDEEDTMQFANRLVIAVGGGVHSGKTGADVSGMAALPLMTQMIPSLIAIAQPWHAYRVYLAFDNDDPFYSIARNREAINEHVAKLVAEENARRWHPPEHTEASLDYSQLYITVHWVLCNYNRRPAVSHSDAIMAAYHEGADYALRINDDTSLPKAVDWVDQFVIWLRSRDPIPNFGVIGPKCVSGNVDILTHDFTHKTHAIIFGFIYPLSLTDWSSDDWITHMYNFYHRMEKSSIEVIHHIHARRYELATGDARLAAMNWELHSGAKWIDAWSKDHFGIVLPHDEYEVKCC